MEQIPYFSKRFLLKRYLGLTEEEIRENEELWDEEQADATPPDPTGQDLRSVGVTPADLDSDLTTGEELSNLGEPGDETMNMAAGAPGQQPAAGAAAPGPAPAV